MKKYMTTAAYVICYLLVTALLGKGIGKLWWSGIIPKKFAEKNYDIQSLIAFLIALIIFGVIFKLRNKSFFEVCRFSPMSKKNVLIFIGIGLLMGGFTSLVCATDFVHHNFPIYNDYLYFVVNGTSNYVLFLLIIAVMFAFEEIIFRGVIFGEILITISGWKAVLLSTFVYCLVNVVTMNASIGIYAFCAALLYTMAYVFMQSLFASIILQVSSIYIISIFIKAGLWEKFRKLNDVVLFSLAGIIVLIIAASYYRMYLTYRKQNADGHMEISL